ncbi:MAG: NADH/ubiquinone/plastoquinone (complex I) [Elusimicrobia bacterium]|nr:NADH/ubiquinone/plastoquinone (complex I) [Elusimicrobiota bacterium]
MNILPLFVTIPLAGAFVVSLFDFIKDEKKKNISTNIFASLAGLVLLVISIKVIGSAGVYSMGKWKLPEGIVLVLDPFSGPILLITNLISFICILFSFDYMSGYNGREKYYSLFFLMVAGMNGLVLTGDIFNLYVFLEIASVASYALVGFGTMREEIEATFKYMVLSSVATAFMLLGVAFIYGFTFNLNMVSVAKALGSMEAPVGVYVALGLFIIGFSIKSALIPFHAWLPDAHPSAPAPISAMLSSVVIKTVGMYSLIRICYVVFGMNTGQVPEVLRVLGILSMMLGVLLALGQWDFKRLLAYHSVSQMGYIALGFGLGTPLGVIGGIYHLLNHSVFKSLLFLNSGAVYYRTGTRDLKEMGGLGKKMPVTGATSMIASMSIAGIPPFNGFWSKLIIIMACIKSSHPWLAFWAVLGSILTLASFLKVQRYGFLGKVKDSLRNVKEAPFMMQVSMITLALLCLAMGGLMLPGLYDLIFVPAAGIILDQAQYLKLVLGN